MKMNFFLFVMVFSFFTACDKNAESPSAVMIDRAYTILYINEQNVNLLDPANGYINVEQIKNYYEIDGTLQEVYNSQMDFSRNFMVYPNEYDHEYVLKVFVNTDDDSEITKTVIDFGNGDSHIIMSKVRRVNSSVFTEIVTWNGEPVERIDWSEIGDYPYDFVIVKKD